jgi:hypothetical protein
VWWGEGRGLGSARLDSGGVRADRHQVTRPLRTAAMILLTAVLLALSAGCATDPAGQIDAATDSAVNTAVRGLPGVTDASVTEAKGPPVTVAIALTTAFDPTSPDDVTSAADLLKEAASMVYATRHDTFDSVAVTVYGMTPSATTALMAQNTFQRAQLSAG